MSLERRDKPDGYETEQRDVVVAKVIRKPAVRTPEVLDCEGKENDVLFPTKINNGITIRRVNAGETFEVVNAAPSGTVVGTINPLTVNNGDLLICTKVSPYVSIDGSHWFVTEGNQNEAEIDQIILDLQNNDSVLQDAIDQEIIDRTNADSILQGNIDQEIIDRTNADSILQGNIDQEVIDRTNADSVLQDAIDTKIDISEKGAANGVPPLNENKIIPEEYIDIQSTVNKVKTTTIGNVDATFKNQFEDFTIEGSNCANDIIMFEGSDIAYIFGNGGELKRSEDRGETWTDVTKPATYTGLIQDSHFFSPSEGIIVGQNGIMHTVDGTNGTEWEIVHPFSDDIWRVDFAGDVGFASVTGNLLFKTTDRGRTWTEVIPGVGGYRAGAIALLDENTIIFAYWDEFIIKSSDGGVTWRFVKIQSRSYIRDIKFVDDVTGYAIDELGTIQKTTDKGETWTALNINHFALLYRIYIVDKNEIYFSGQNGIIIKTVDEGETAEKYYVGKNIYTTGFYKTSDNYLYVSGTEGTILRTKSNILSGINDTLLLEGGWEDMSGEFQPEIGTSTAHGGAFRIFHIDENVGFCTGTNAGTIDGVIVGANQLVKTTDGGKTWEVIYTAAEGNLYGVSFSDELNGWMSGSAGKFYQTNDGGATWTIKQLQYEGVPYTASDFNQIYTGSPNHMFSCKSDGSVALTKDGGATWLAVTGTQGQLGALSFVSENVGFLGMYAWGTFWKAKRTTDGGETWEDNWTGGSTHFSQVSAFDENIMYLIDQTYHIIWKTTDGGDTWDDIYQFPDVNRTAGVKVDNIDPNKVWVSGADIYVGNNTYAIIKYSEDGGLTWTTQYKEPWHGWSDFYFIYMKDGKGIARSRYGQNGIRNLDSYNSLLDGFDNVLFVKDDLVLLKDQTAAAQNGVYLVKEKHPGFIELVREKAFDQSDELTSSTTVSVESGTLYKDCEFMQKTGGEIIVGWTPLVWEKSFDPSTSNLFSKVESRIVTPAEEAAEEIVLEANFTDVTLVLKQGRALFPELEYTRTGNTISIPDILENDTLIFILS